MSNGKGSKRRPSAIDEDMLSYNWTQTFKEGILRNTPAPQHAQHAGVGNPQEQESNDDK